MLYYYNNSAKIIFKTYNHSIKIINRKTKTVINKHSINFNSPTTFYKLIYNFNTFYIRNTSRNFKVRYNENVSEIKCRISSAKPNLAKYVLTNTLIILVST